MGVRNDLASARTGDGSGSDQDGDQLVGLTLERWLDAQQGELVRESKTVEGLSELLGG